MQNSFEYIRSREDFFKKYFDSYLVTINFAVYKLHRYLVVVLCNDNYTSSTRHVYILECI